MQICLYRWSGTEVFPVILLLLSCSEEVTYITETFSGPGIRFRLTVWIARLVEVLIQFTIARTAHVNVRFSICIRWTLLDLRNFAMFTWEQVDMKK